MAQTRDVQVVSRIVGLRVRASECINLSMQVARDQESYLPSVGVPRTRAATAAGTPRRDVAALSTAWRGSIASGPGLVVSLGTVAHRGVCRNADAATVGCRAHVLRLPGWRRTVRTRGKKRVNETLGLIQVGARRRMTREAELHIGNKRRKSSRPRTCNIVFFSMQSTAAVAMSNKQGAPFQSAQSRPRHK